MNVDLHCHSTISDGALTPRDLVRRAAEKGVDALALTDHDNLDGLDEARAAADCAIRRATTHSALAPGRDACAACRIPRD